MIIFCIYFCISVLMAADAYRFILKERQSFIDHCWLGNYDLWWIAALN